VIGPRGQQGDCGAPVGLRSRQPFAASFLAREPVNVVSQRLGHSSPMITMTVYAHVLPGNQREAANTFARLIREASGA
jgi:integrase